MKRIYNYVILSIFAFAAVACLDELNQGDNLANLGNEVQFGLSLNDPVTKTIYGTPTENAYPIYWSEGDKIQVASPQCVKGRNVAEYLVTPQPGQNYAQAITRTSDVGVQWGNTAAADFYSIYPSGSTTWPSLTEDKVVARLKIASEQSANLVLLPADTDEDGDIISPQMYQSADMSSVIMYSKTTANNGDVVELNYKPYSTVLEFEIELGENIDKDGHPMGTYGSVKIMSLTLTAPENIALAGDFNFEFNDNGDPIVTATEDNNSSVISMEYATHPVLNENTPILKSRLSIIPLRVEKLQDWKVEVEVLNGTDAKPTKYTKTLNVSSALEPGMIHKVKLPLFRSETEWVPEPDKWITTLYDYKNIYLTELSLPGAWYALGKSGEGYQLDADNTAATLWSKGVRAFAIECRSSRQTGISSINSVVVSGTGNNTLGAYWGGTQISSIISQIAAQAAESLIYDKEGNVVDGEFAVLVLSYADGGSGGQSADYWKYFLQGVAKQISNSKADNIYSTAITPNTTVHDVLGKLIIKVNVDANITKGSYGNDANLLLSYNPFISQMTNVDFEKPNFSNLVWQNWSDDNKTTTSYNSTSGFYWCFSSSNRTQLDSGTDADLPTYAQRQKALGTMMKHSNQLTDEEVHNVWFYFNAGGTQATSVKDEEASPELFAAQMNPWLLDLIRLKANGGDDTRGIYGTKGAYVESDPSPLGIVMFNQCTNEEYDGPDIIDEIVRMNDKFKLQRANGGKAKSAAPSYASGMDTSDSAFGWD